MAKPKDELAFYLQEHVRIGRVEIWRRIPNESHSSLLTALERRDQLTAEKSNVQTFTEQLRRLRGWTTKLRVVDEFGDLHDYPNPKQ